MSDIGKRGTRFNKPTPGEGTRRSGRRVEGIQQPEDTIASPVEELEEAVRRERIRRATQPTQAPQLVVVNPQQPTQVSSRRATQTPKLVVLNPQQPPQAPLPVDSTFDSNLVLAFLALFSMILLFLLGWYVGSHSE